MGGCPVYDLVIKNGQVIDGTCVSNTVTVCWHVVAFPEASVTVITTGVTPIETSDPATGDWVIIKEPVGVQLSEATTPRVKSGTAAWQFSFANAV